MDADTIVLNPDYHFKNDINRVVMYSQRHVLYDSSQDWIGYIHPVQAMILGLFTSNEQKNVQFRKIEKHFNIPYEKVVELISPFICNPTPVYTVLGGKRILFPKNVLVFYTSLPKGSLVYDFTMQDLRRSEINLIPDRMHRGPQSLLFMLTNKCTTSCKYCYADRKTTYEELSTGEILHIIDEAHKLKMSYIDVIGGEIFCKKDWDVILERLVNYGLTPNYISTKVPITNSIINKLKVTKYNNMIQISLDSLEEDVLRDIIRCPNGYVKRTLKGIERLEEANFKIQIDTILTNRNCNEQQIVDLYKYIRTIKNLQYWEIRVPEMSIYNVKTFAETKASRKDIDFITNFIKGSIMQDADITIYLSTEAFDTKFHYGKPEDECFQGGKCGILENRLFVLPDGKVSICEQLYWLPQFIIGDLRKQTFEEIWNSNKALSLFNMENSMFKNSPCLSCKMMDTCNKRHRRCIVKTIKAYGTDNWNYPDPRCIYSPDIDNDLKY